MIVSSGVVPPTELRTIRDIVRFCERRRRTDRSLRQVASKAPQRSKPCGQLADALVEQPQSLARERDLPQVSRDQMLAGLRIGFGISFGVDRSR